MVSIIKNRLLHLLLSCLILIAASASGQDLKQLEANLQNIQADSHGLAAYHKLVKYYKPVNIDSAYYYAEQGLQAMTKAKFLPGEAQMIEQLGKMDQAQGRLELAKRRMTYAMKLYMELGNATGIAAMHNCLGALEATMGNSATAMPRFIAALKIYDSLKTDLEGSLVTNMNMGCLYLQNGDTTNSAKYLFRAEAISKKIPVSDITISLYNYIGVLYAVRGNMPKALEYFLEDVKISDKPEFMASHVECLNYLGSFYNDMGNLPKAMEYLKQGLAIAKERKLAESQADILLQMAHLLAGTQTEQAVAYAKEALALSENMHSKTLKKDIYKALSGIYEQSGDYKESIAALKKYQRIEDSVSKADRVKELTSMSAVYELEKSNLRIEEISRQRNMVTAITIIIIVALVAVVMLYLNTRKLNIKLVKHEAELTELSNTKNKLFSIIGHDLRWPVARIPTILEIVDDDSLPEDERKYLIDSLKEHTKATVETLDKLLYWGQSLMKGLQLVPEKFFPKQFIMQAIDLRRIAAADKEIIVTDHTPDKLQVHSDATHFDFIIRNLLGNAIKFTGSKGRIDFYADEEQKPGFVVFAVQDTGVGIDKERLQKIFEPFNSKQGTANEKGTGIGLMLCKEFVEKNGGSIWATSEPGKGTTFYFSVKK